MKRLIKIETLKVAIQIWTPCRAFQAYWDPVWTPADIISMCSHD